MSTKTRSKGKVVTKQVKQVKDTGVTEGVALLDLHDIFEKTNPSIQYFSHLSEKNPNELIEYIRERRHSKVQKVGVIVGFKVNNKILVSWSKCNGKADNFDPEYGIRFAMGRALGEYDAVPMPESIKTQVRQFSSRCVRFFKDANSLEIM